MPSERHRYGTAGDLVRPFLTGRPPHSTSPRIGQGRVGASRIVDERSPISADPERTSEVLGGDGGRFVFPGAVALCPGGADVGLVLGVADGEGLPGGAGAGAGAGTGAAGRLGGVRTMGTAGAGSCGTLLPVFEPVGAVEGDDAGGCAAGTFCPDSPAGSRNALTMTPTAATNAREAATPNTGPRVADRPCLCLGFRNIIRTGV